VQDRLAPSGASVETPDADADSANGAKLPQGIVVLDEQGEGVERDEMVDQDADALDQALVVPRQRYSARRLTERIEATR
jgi:hypothetical protein